jgi:hypothetical protein
MSHSIKNNRISIYLSNRKDKDLINALEVLEVGDICWFVKELLRDGLRYRNIVNTGNVTPSQSSDISIDKVITNVQGVTSYNELLYTNLTRVELTNEEAEELFDKL